MALYFQTSVFMERCNRGYQYTPSCHQIPQLAYIDTQTSHKKDTKCDGTRDRKYTHWKDGDRRSKTIDSQYFNWRKYYQLHINRSSTASGTVYGQNRCTGKICITCQGL